MEENLSRDGYLYLWKQLLTIKDRGVESILDCGIIEGNTFINLFTQSLSGYNYLPISIESTFIRSTIPNLVETESYSCKIKERCDYSCGLCCGLHWWGGFPRSESDFDWIEKWRAWKWKANVLHPLNSILRLELLVILYSKWQGICICSSEEEDN